MLNAAPFTARALVAATAIALSALLPTAALADTMEGVISDFSSGNRSGSFSLIERAGQDTLGFTFGDGTLRIEGIWWGNMLQFGGSPRPGYTSSIACPRKSLCTIVMRKTHVRVEYSMQDDNRIATNIIALDPDGPNKP